MRQVKKKKQKRFFVIPLKWKIIIVLILALVIGTGVFLNTQVGQKCLKQVEAARLYMRQKSGLFVKTVIVDGHARTSLKEINKAIGLTRGMPIFDVDVRLVQQQIQSLPWIRSVVVERHLPDTIYIKIVEKTPIAIWQNQKSYWPVDETGAVVPDNKTPVGSVLLVVGKDALEYTPDLIKTLEKFPRIREKVRSAVRVGDRRWDLILNDITDGLIVRLPENNIEQTLERIARQDEKADLLKRDLKVIDVRSPDRIFIQTTDIK